MWWTKKPSQEEVGVLSRHLEVLEERHAALSQALAVLAREVRRLQKMKGESMGRTRSQVEEWLPVMDRMHEIALVAMGHPDLAQSFGLQSRQVRDDEVEVKWEEPTENEGMVYE